jgi:predicted amidohydrolase
VAALDTAAGPVAVGAMICYDREFPESARVLMLIGAEIVLVPNACDLEVNRLSQLRARAYENMIGVALANYAGPNDFGHSVAFDGMAFDRHGSREMTLVEAGEAEGIFIAGFDLDALRDYRRRETWGNAFRRPRRYGLLASPVVLPPFVRVNAKAERWDVERR